MSAFEDWQWEDLCLYTADVANASETVETMTEDWSRIFSRAAEERLVKV